MNYELKTSRKSGFSLLELSVVLLVLSVLTLSIIQGKEIIRKSRISAAAQLTKSSVVNKIDGLYIWYETTMPNSFDSAETVDSGLISTWHDISNYSNSSINATASGGNRPTYISNAMNNLPVLRFDGSSDYMGVSTRLLRQSDYTIFIVHQRRSSDDELYFIGGHSRYHDMIRVGYQSSTSLLYGHGNVINHSAAIDAYTVPIPRILSISHSSTFGKEMYLDGTLIDSDPNLTPTIAESTTTIGKFSSSYYNGDIAEMIFFNRFLSSQERRDVEKYLSVKWGISVS
jgi:prepilin-type N-terminal cleavage/methylation domain-containing protein